jgi:alcohol dehydrogenase YqhD (iron-dependent ADH family)
MNNFIFYSPTEFVFGRDTEAQTGALVKKQGAKKVMIVYGGGSVIRSGLLSRVESSLKEVGIVCWVVYNLILSISKYTKALSFAGARGQTCYSQ